MPDRRDETDETQSQGTSNLAWFLTGAMIGATAAILYAPKSGKETRQYIADKTQESREAVETASGDIVEAGREMFDRGRKLVEDAADLFDRGRKLVKG
uniref:YtxH domain-containing protein n=1 Tax=Solibacter usitatus (strain Ellin6076) TaxID=234267 RepID=Q029Z2_SOLUE